VRAIRREEEAPRPVVIALTASSFESDRQAILDSGMDDYLTKPCREEVLLERLQAHLGVQYRFSAGPAPAEHPQPPRPSSAAAASIPAQAAQGLLGAIENGDKEGLDRLIAALRDADEEAAGVLQRMADNYEYDALTELLSTTLPEKSPGLD